MGTATISRHCLGRRKGGRCPGTVSSRSGGKGMAEGKRTQQGYQKDQLYFWRCHYCVDSSRVVGGKWTIRVCMKSKSNSHSLVQYSGSWGRWQMDSRSWDLSWSDSTVVINLRWFSSGFRFNFFHTERKQSRRIESNQSSIVATAVEYGRSNRCAIWRLFLFFYSNSDDVWDPTRIFCSRFGHEFRLLTASDASPHAKHSDNIHNQTYMKTVVATSTYDVDPLPISVTQLRHQVSSY